MSFEIRPATRKGVVPLIALYSESGCGKTFSALLMARGIAGPSGKVRMIDSEAGRGSLYADVPAVSPYETIALDAPFTPARYVEALEFAETGADVVIIDSGSHEWEGPGGVLDSAMANEERSKKKGLHNWKTPKFQHAIFVAKLLRARVPVIVCLRAKHKTRQGKDAKGETVIIKDDKTSPIQADDFIFEATAHMEILQDHSINLTKCSHPELRKCFPTDGPITVETGRRIAAWCIGATDAGEIASAKRTIWTTLKGAHKTKEGVQQYLWDEALMETDVNLETASLIQLKAIVSKLGKLQPA